MKHDLKKLHNLTTDEEQAYWKIKGRKFLAEQKTKEEEEEENERFTCNDILLMENHLRYMTKQLMDKEDRYEYFEVFRNQRTGKTTIISDEPEREEDEY